MIGIKMITLSIWTSQHDWIINLDLLFWLKEWVIIWLVDYGLFDWVKLISKLK
jgi:hypothetical protein